MADTAAFSKPDPALFGPDAASALEFLSDTAGAIVARTEDWSRINSGSYEAAGLVRMADVLADGFSVLPGAVARISLTPSTRVGADGRVREIEHGPCLRLQVRPEAPIQVALTGHYDTVFPASHAFQTPWRDGDVLHGPGVADMKGGLSLMLAALEAFERLKARDRVGYTVLLSPDEEIGSPASAALLHELGARADFAMIYEPAQADGGLVSARKGSGNFSLVFKGRAAHVGRAFASGRNAVIAAARAGAEIDALNGAREGVTFNVGAIDGGAAVNVVPDNAVLRFNARAPDDERAAWALGEIERIARAAHGRGEVEAVLHGSFGRPAKPLSPAIETIMRWLSCAGEALGQELRFAPSGGVCEGNNLAAAGCPNIDTLGPQGGGLHTDGEFALISSFGPRAQLSLLLLAGAAQGGFDVRELKA